MLYRDEYLALAPAADSATEASADPAFEGLGVRLRSFELLSAAREFLPGALAYRCPAHGLRFDAAAAEHGTQVFQPGDGSLHMPDCDIESNSRYRCLMMEPATETPRGVILLLHGLNEKRWDKYLPWALRLVRGTGKAVMLFPISFHMNRTPASSRIPSAPSLRRSC